MSSSVAQRATASSSPAEGSNGATSSSCSWLPRPGDSALSESVDGLDQIEDLARNSGCHVRAASASLLSLASYSAVAIAQASEWCSRCGWVLTPSAWAKARNAGWHGPAGLGCRARRAATCRVQQLAGTGASHRRHGGEGVGGGAGRSCHSWGSRSAPKRYLRHRSSHRVLALPHLMDTGSVVVVVSGLNDDQLIIGRAIDEAVLIVDPPGPEA